jgi:hypothetical protein
MELKLELFVLEISWRKLLKMKQEMKIKEMGIEFKQFVKAIEMMESLRHHSYQFLAKNLYFP